MPRKALIKNDFVPYHVTSRANNKEQFLLPLEVVWEIITFELWSLQLIYEIEIHAFVLMPNHFHLLLTVPNSDLGKIMNLLMANATTRMNKQLGRSGHVFGGPYYWNIILSSRYFGHALKYVYRNPVKAKLCEKVEQYPHSSLYGLAGKTHLPFPISYTRAGMEFGLPVEKMDQFLNWLNHSFPAEIEKLIQVGLRKKVFDRTEYEKKRFAKSKLDYFY